MSNMAKQDEIKIEQCGREFLGIMEDNNFSLTQKRAVIELMQKRLFPPLKLMVAGKLIEIPSAQVIVFESQFAEFEECCVKNCRCSVYKWVENSGSDESIAETLKTSYFGHLATPEWIAFLKHKVKLNECAAAA